MKVNKLLIASAAALGMLATSGQAQDSGRHFSIHIHKVAQTDNLDPFDALGSDKADFYTMLWLNGKHMKDTDKKSTDVDITNWRWNVMSADRYVSIKLRLMDDDGGLENKDDHVDINPMSGKKDLDLLFDTWTGTFTGDMSGRRGVMYHAAGEGDSMRGQVWFSIQ
jgi:hypothetical protein